MANGDSDWKVWAIRLGFGVAALLLSATLWLAANSFSSMKTQFSIDVTRIENVFEKHIQKESELSAKQDQRFDELCKRVGDQGVIIREHDILLRQPWPQRKEFYLFQKNKVVP